MLKHLANLTQKSLPWAAVALGFLQQGTILPEAYAPKPNDKDSATATVDPTLEDWLAQNKATESPLDMDSKAFAKFITKLDPTARVFLKLRYATSQQSGEAVALKEALAYLGEIEGSQSAHPLLPYLLEEIIQSSSGDSELTEKLNARLLAAPEKSCPQREAILRAIADSRSNASVAVSAADFLERITSYRSRRFREEALETIVTGIKEDQRATVRESLRKAATDFPRLLTAQRWLLGDEQLVTEVKDSKKLARRVQQVTGTNHCQSGEKILESAVTERGSAISFDEAAAGAQAVDNCLRGKAIAHRSKFWKRAEKWLTEKYGFDGSELAWRKIGSIEWSVDHFAEAEAAFRKIAMATVTGQGEKISNGVYLLARVAENKGDIAQALAYYSQYSKEYPAGTQREDVMRAMVLLGAVSGQHKLALQHATTIIDEEDNKPMDDRAVGAQSFALFWAGRLHLIQNEPELALKLWRRVASEYYSTFYGAIGHYMTERLSGESFALEPSRATAFRLSSILDNVKSSERAQADRIVSLLQTGLKDEASCEIFELANKGDHPATALTKALFLYASGEWLEAIKIFDALPRSFRNSLAIGFERLLFPRAFDGMVDDYSQKLGVDPDLVFAIIRQESVFNPRAQSGAGARGLMQMMPATARVEAHRLKRSYLPSARRRQLERLAQNRDTLFDPEINVALGVHHVHRLLQRYQNPIFVLTSYNANPKATERWLRAIPTDDFLVFVERIPYMETRLYVKLVLRNYFYYKRWYNGPDGKMPHIDALLAQDLALVQPKATKQVQ